MAKRPDTRARLIDATADLIWGGSFHSAGVDDICRAADVRKGSFYHFFPSKTALAIEAIRSSWERVRTGIVDPIFDTDEGGLARLRALTDAVDRLQRDQLGKGEAYLGCPFGSIGQEMAHQDPELKAVVQKVFEGHIDYFERAIHEAVEAGQAEPGDERRRARKVMALLEGALLVAKISNDPDRFTEAAEEIPAIAAGGKGAT